MAFPPLSQPWPGAVGIARSAKRAVCVVLRSLPSPSGKRQRGVYALEFALVLLGSLSLLIPMSEFLRLSLFDQALARATHQAALAASGDPGNCEARITGVFQPRDGETLIGWLLDAHDDGAVGVALADDWPDPNDAAREVVVAVGWDDNPNNGLDWADGCGRPGAWIRVRSRIVVRPWFLFAQTLWPDGFSREHVSWARNQLGA